MTIRSVRRLGTLLCVWAHPDDEAYLCAGIMAMAAAAGQRVVCVTATKGESGSPDPARWPVEEMGEIRRRELAACLEVLGVGEHRWLGYPDGDCASVPTADGAASVGAILDDVQPDTVLTFGPDGYTGHPDHRAVSSWVITACRDRTLLDALHVVAQPPSWLEEFGTGWLEVGAFPDGLPSSTPDGDLSIEIDLPDEVLDQKLCALAAQTSQTEALIDRLGPDFYGRSVAVERYRSATSRT